MHILPVAGNHLPRMATPDPCTVTSLASRQLLELLTAALHVPSLHAAHMVAAGTLLPQARGPQVDAALMQPLLNGRRAVTSLCCGSAMPCCAVLCCLVLILCCTVLCCACPEAQT